MGSFLLTLSSIISTFSFIMVAVKIESAKSVKGVSLKMMECYIIVFLGRLFAIVPFEGYLPYVKETDTLKHIWLIAPSLVIAVVFHPNLNNFMPSDISWAFALYLESVTVLPQLFVFMKQGTAEPFTSHFLAAQAMSKLASFIFWASSFTELSNQKHYIKSLVGNWVVDAICSTSRHGRLH